MIDNSIEITNRTNHNLSTFISSQVKYLFDDKKVCQKDRELCFYIHVLTIAGFHVFVIY